MEQPNWEPWIDYSGVTVERLMLVANVIRLARDAAADDHHPLKGETNWTLGVSAYERTCFALFNASQELPWLTIEVGGSGGPVQFVFAVDGHPIRFCHGEPDDIPSRYQQPILPELLTQLKLALEEQPPAGRFLRMTISNDADGRPANIYLAEMDQGEAEPLNIYLIPPMEGSVAIFAPTVPPAALPPVVAEAADATESVENSEPAQETKTGSDDN
jgi:hypothetical protein